MTHLAAAIAGNAATRAVYTVSPTCNSLLTARLSALPCLLPWPAELKQQAQQMRRMLQQLQGEKEAAQGGQPARLLLLLTSRWFQPSWSCSLLPAALWPVITFDWLHRLSVCRLCKRPGDAGGGPLR